MIYEKFERRKNMQEYKQNMNYANQRENFHVNIFIIELLRF